MAVIRSLILRRSTLSLLRARSLSSAAAISPAKTQTSSSSTPWKWIAVRNNQTKSAKNKQGSRNEDDDFSFNKPNLLDDYKFAYEDFKPRELDITEIEGCDLKHWLITVEFPKYPRPSPENMVRFYEETVAKTLNLSLDNAKKKIYACSTSNYTGFHVQVTEEESEKFRGKPGVVFILPDSYVDKEKKEYGGDKYINGVIIPRSRPTLNGKDNKEEPEKDKDKREGPLPTQQESPSVQIETRLDQEHRSSYSQDKSSQPNQQRIPPPYSQQGPNRNHHDVAPPSHSPPPQHNYAPQYSQYSNHGAPPSYPQPPQNYGPTYIQHSPPYIHQWSTQGGPPSFPSASQHYRPPSPVAASFGRVSYQQGTVCSIPYQGNYNPSWAINYAPPPLPMGFGWPSQPYGPNPSNAFYYCGQCYGPLGYGPQANWQGQPYSGGYHTPPTGGQDYAPPGDYRNYGPQQGSPYGQQQQEEDGDYQGQGPPMGYWRG